MYGSDTHAHNINLDSATQKPYRQVDCSLLTGESDLIPASVEKKHDLVLESRNVMFMSCLCMNGDARGVVVRTGDHTMIGNIASLTAKQEQQKSTLQVCGRSSNSRRPGLALLLSGFVRPPHPCACGRVWLLACSLV